MMNGQQRYEEDTIVSCKGHRAVNIEAIPTTTELRLSCSQNLSELTFQLQTVQKGIVSISHLCGTECDWQRIQEAPCDQRNLN